MIKVLLISTVAALGGLAVFVGLWLEKIGDREEYQAIDDFRKSKIHRKIGERLVRWGVFAEMLLGFGVAALEGWEALNNNPLNQPVADISVSIVVNLAGTNFEHINDPYELRLNNWVMLLDNKTNVSNLNLGRIDSLMAEDVLPFTHSEFQGNRVTSHGDLTPKRWT